MLLKLCFLRKFLQLLNKLLLKLKLNSWGHCGFENRSSDVFFFDRGKRGLNILRKLIRSEREFSYSQMNNRCFKLSSEIHNSAFIFFDNFLRLISYGSCFWVWHKTSWAQNFRTFARRGIMSGDA